MYTTIVKIAHHYTENCYLFNHHLLRRYDVEEYSNWEHNVVPERVLFELDKYPTLNEVDKLLMAICEEAVAEGAFYLVVLWGAYNGYDDPPSIDECEDYAEENVDEEEEHPR